LTVIVVFCNKCFVVAYYCYYCEWNWSWSYIALQYTFYFVRNSAMNIEYKIQTFYRTDSVVLTKTKSTEKGKEKKKVSLMGRVQL